MEKFQIVQTNRLTRESERVDIIRLLNVKGLLSQDVVLTENVKELEFENKRVLVIGKHSLKRMQTVKMESLTEMEVSLLEKKLNFKTEISRYENGRYSYSYTYEEVSF